MRMVPTVASTIYFHLPDIMHARMLCTMNYIISPNKEKLKQFGRIHITTTSYKLNQHMHMIACIKTYVTHASMDVYLCNSKHVYMYQTRKKSFEMHTSSFCKRMCFSASSFCSFFCFLSATIVLFF